MQKFAACGQNIGHSFPAGEPQLSGKTVHVSLYTNGTRLYNAVYSYKIPQHNMLIWICMHLIHHIHRYFYDYILTYSSMCMCVCHSMSYVMSCHVMYCNVM